MTDRVLRESGIVTVYQIEAQFPKSKDPYYSERWYQRSLTAADFGEPVPKYGDNWEEVCPLSREWGACGDCWQQTGLNGFFDEDLAVKAFVALITHVEPDKYVAQWRLVKRTITVEVETQLEFKLNMTRKKKK